MATKIHRADGYHENTEVSNMYILSMLVDNLGGGDLKTNVFLSTTPGAITDVQSGGDDNLFCS